MHELTPANVVDYLRSRGRISAEESPNVEELSGGVSNAVLLVDRPGFEPFVLKQCRERLRVAAEWTAPLDRIWAEHAALRVLDAILPDGVVPRILFEDRDEYLFAMTCAPADSENWKTRMLRGDSDPAIASSLGRHLAKIHTEAPQHPDRAPLLDGTSLFHELRIDPYYRTTAKAHPSLAPAFDSLIADMAQPPERRALVLGDFSPKNILVHSGGLVLLDFECAHLGDPTFDLGFFLSHLTLKRIHGALGNDNFHKLADGFLEAYFGCLGDRLGPPDDLAERGVRHTAACLLSRVDGKSPVEYLDEAGRACTRRFALALFSQSPGTWSEARRILDDVALSYS